MELAERIGLSVFKDKDVNSGRPILDDDEQILHEFKSVKLILSVNDDQGAGTLYITDRYGAALTVCQPGGSLPTTVLPPAA